jgi:hypothetical protein
MLTDTDVTRFVTLAGPTFAWSGVPGCSRPASDVRKALRADLRERQGGICPQCGDDVAENVAEFCHVVARGPKVKGFIPGNVFAGHSWCNASTKPLYDDEGTLIRGIEVLTPDMFARPDLVPDEWTPFPVLRARKDAHTYTY